MLLVIIITCLLLNLTLIGCINHLKVEEFDKAMSFFDKWLNPSNCSNQNYAIVEMGMKLIFLFFIFYIDNNFYYY